MRRPFKAGRWLMPALVALACAPSSESTGKSAANVAVAVRNGGIESPDTISAGWKRIRVNEDGQGHIVVVFRLERGTSTTDIAEFLSALDTAAATPATAVALGGPEVGDSGEVVMQLKPGVHVLACVRRGKDNHRHAITGEAKVILVVNDQGHSTGSAPRATAELRMVDFAYAGADTLSAGPQMLRLVNKGGQDHQLRLVRLRSGSSIDDWMNAKDPETHGSAVVGAARMGPGQVVYLPALLAPGSYVAFCLVTDPSTKLPHVSMGMLRPIQVR